MPKRSKPEKQKIHKEEPKDKIKKTPETIQKVFETAGITCNTPADEFDRESPTTGFSGPARPSGPSASGFSGSSAMTLPDPSSPNLSGSSVSGLPVPRLFGLRDSASAHSSALSSASYTNAGYIPGSSEDSPSLKEAYSLGDTSSLPSNLNREPASSSIRRSMDPRLPQEKVDTSSTGSRSIDMVPESHQQQGRTTPGLDNLRAMISRNSHSTATSESFANPLYESSGDTSPKDTSPEFTSSEVKEKPLPKVDDSQKPTTERERVSGFGEFGGADDLLTREMSLDKEDARAESVNSWNAMKFNKKLISFDSGNLLSARTPDVQDKIQKTPKTIQKVFETAGITCNTPADEFDRDSPTTGFPGPARPSGPSTSGFLGSSAMTLPDPSSPNLSGSSVSGLPVPRLFGLRDSASAHSSALSSASYTNAGYVPGSTEDSPSLKEAYSLGDTSSLPSNFNREPAFSPIRRSMDPRLLQEKVDTSSTESKNYGSNTIRIQPLPMLSHMPGHIKQKIFGCLNHEDQWSLRQCSKQCRNAVDRSVTDYVFFSIEIHSDKAQIEYGNVTHTAIRRILKTTYQDDPNGYQIITEDHRQMYNRVVKGKGNWLDRTVRFLQSIYKSPKKTVGRLRLEFSTSMETDAGNLIKAQFLEKMSNAFQRSHEAMLKVRRLTLSIESDQHILPALQMFRPGFLEYIGFYANTQTTLEGVTETEQWKQAKTFHNDGFQLALPYEKWAHLRLFFAKIKSMTTETWMLILEKFKRTPEWESYDFLLHEKNTQIKRYFASLPRTRDRNCFGDKLRRLELPNSTTHYIGVFVSRGKINLHKVDIE